MLNKKKIRISNIYNQKHNMSVVELKIFVRDKEIKITFSDCKLLKSTTLTLLRSGH